jgi:hypothetical protein
MHGSIEFRFGLLRRREQNSSEKRRTLRRGAAVGAIFVLASVYENSHSGPAMVVTPGSVSFAAVGVGSSGTIQNVRIKNEGVSPLEVLSLEITGPDAEDFATQNASCVGRKLEPGDECEVAVNIRPATIGSLSAQLEIRGSDSNHPHVVSLAGEGTGQAHLIITPLDLKFEARLTGDETPAQELRLHNTGTAPLKVSRISVTGTAALDFTLDSKCEDNDLRPGEICPVEVAFRPQSEGVRQATVNVTDTAGDGVHSASVTGEGLARIAAGSWQPDHLEISTHTDGDARAVRSAELKSEGTIPLELGQAKIIGEGERLFQIVSDSCSGSTIDTNRTCNLGVALVSHETGKWGAAVAYKANTSSGEVRLQLVGYAVAPKVPQIRIDPPNLVFEQLQPNQKPRPQEVVISNPGGATLLIRSFRIDGTSSFSLISTGKCEGIKLEFEQSCKLSVAYSPVGSMVALFKRPPASDSGTLLIEDNASGSPHRVNLQGTRTRRQPCCPFDRTRGSLATLRLVRKATRLWSC